MEAPLAERRRDEDSRRRALANGEGWTECDCIVWMNVKKIINFNFQLGNQFRCRQWKFTAHLRLSKPRKLNPFAKWQVHNGLCYIFGNWKMKKCRQFVSAIAQFRKVMSMHRGFYKWKMKDGSKKICSAIGNWYRIFPSRICQSLYDVKPKAQSEQCVPFCQLAIRCPITNYCMRWRCNFKGWVTGGFFLKTSAPLSLNDDLTKEPNFGWIHLAGQYL